jgi:hypothetical protein
LAGKSWGLIDSPIDDSWDLLDADGDEQQAHSSRAWTGRWADQRCAAFASLLALPNTRQSDIKEGATTSSGAVQ